ncbi:MAG: hypothetical protein AABZ29_09980 [Gemmatimonadota bacterium]
MLTYLDSLCDAMVARDMVRLRALIDDHPLARLLPADATSEVRRFVAGKASVHAVPMVMLRFRDRTARLLSEVPRAELPADESSTPQRLAATSRRRGRRRANQMELPLSA